MALPRKGDGRDITPFQVTSGLPTIRELLGSVNTRAFTDTYAVELPASGLLDRLVLSDSTSQSLREPAVRPHSSRLLVFFFAAAFCFTRGRTSTKRSPIVNLSDTGAPSSVLPKSSMRASKTTR